MRAPLPDNCEYLPVWKDGATPEERLLEVSAIAAKHPERFAKMVVIFAEDPPKGRTTVRYAGTGVTTMELLGLLRLCEWEIRNVVTN